MSFGSESQGKPQYEMAILHGKTVQSAIPFHDGADAAHPHAVARTVRYRDAPLELHRFGAVVDHLEKELLALHIGLHHNGAVLLFAQAWRAFSRALDSSTHRSLSAMGSTWGSWAWMDRDTSCFSAREAKADRIRLAASFSQ